MSLFQVRFHEEIDFALFCEGVVVQPVFDFLQFHSLRGLSRQSLRAYAYDLLSLYRFLDESNLETGAIRREEVIRFLAFQQRGKASPRTINRRFKTLRAFLNFHKEGCGDLLLKTRSSCFYKGRRNTGLLGNIYQRSKEKKEFCVKVPLRVLTPLTPFEVKTFLKRVSKYRDLSICLLMLFCGLRSCEILNLEIFDIDLEENQIRIRGKGAKERLLPIAPEVAQNLRSYLDCERPVEEKNSKCFVVLKGGHRGRPMTPAGLRQLFRHRRKKADSHRANPHRFRHTFCTNLIRQGVSLPVVQKLMGHSTIDLTMTYVHMSLADVTKEYNQALKNLQTVYENKNQ